MLRNVLSWQRHITFDAKIKLQHQIYWILTLCCTPLAF